MTNTEFVFLGRMGPSNLQAYRKHQLLDLTLREGNNQIKRKMSST